MSIITLLAAVVIRPVSHAACTPPPAGMVSWWPGEGNAYDVSGGNSGTWTGSGNLNAYAPGVVGQAMVFDGTHRDRVDLGNPANLQLQNFTIEAWVKRSSATVISLDEDFADSSIAGAGGYILGYGAGGYGLVVFDDGSFGLTEDTVNDTRVPPVLTDTNWHHVALTKTGTLVTAFVDGVQQPTPSLNPYTNVFTFTTPVAIASRGDGGGNTFYGSIDEPAVYNRALSSNEIAAIFTAGSAGKCPSTLAGSTGVPAIFSFAPLSGASGTLVSISGTNFSATAVSNIVYFGAMQANVSSASPTNLTVRVPVSATYAPITVTTGSLTAYSAAAFEPTFIGSGTNLTTSSFAPDFILPAGSRPSGSAAGDLDGDGKPDVVVANGQDGTLWIYQNISTNGSLSGTSFAPPVILSLPGTPSRVVLADLDGDGRLDIITTDVANNRVSVFQNLGSPGVITTNSFGARVDFPTGQQPFAVAVRDLNRDGLPDLVTANSADNTISVLQNTGAAGGITTNSFAAHVDFAAGLSPQEVAIGDLDGDGRPDIAATSIGEGTVYVYQNLSAGGPLTTNSFASPVVLTTTGGGEDVAIADVDGDGKPDLLVTGYVPQVISLFQNVSTPGSLATNSFGPRLDFSTGGRAHRLALGDLDGDGRPDIAVTTELPSQLVIFQNLSTPGSLSANALAAPVALANGWNPAALTMVDLDGDGRPDLVSCASYDGDIWVYQNEAPFGSTPVLPSILVQPTNLTVTVNGTGDFTVVAAGTPPFSYQWALNGTNVSGATNATLTLTNVQPAQAGSYSLLVVNIAGSVTSSNAVLTVYVPPTPPTILSQTPSQVVAVGSTVNFSVMVGGSTPLNYFWSENGVLLPNGTNASYSLVNAQLSDSGSTFSCLVTNAYGTAASTNVLLKVIDVVANGLCNGAIIITNASYTNAQSTLKADAPGNPVLDCVAGFGHAVWYEFTAPAAGQLTVDTFGSDYDTGLGVFTGSCDSLTEVACNDDANGGVTSQVILSTTAGTTYFILAGGYASDAGNLILHLNYLTLPAFDTWPTNLFVVVSSNASFNPIVSGTLPISFQWYFNTLPLVDGGRLSGSTNATLTIANVQASDGGNYQLVASNIVGVTTSSVAVLTPVILPPTFLQLPVSQAVGLGSNVSFSVVVGGTPPYSYQWSFNGNPLSDDGLHIAGSTTSSLSISNLTTADTGSYGLTVTNLSGTATATATLSVLTPPVITTQPLGRSVPPGWPTVFTAVVTGTPAPSYQWQLNGTDISDANSLTYSNAAVGTNDLGMYQLVARNLMGVTVSSNALLTLGPVAAWGRNLDNESLPPPGLSHVISVAGSYAASYAVGADGSLAAWGSSAGVPAGASNVVAVASFGNNIANYALRSDGTVLSWDGWPAPALSNIVAVAAGQNFGYALRAEGSLTNWGTIPTPGFPVGLSHLTAIAAGFQNALALRNDGAIFVAGSGAVTNIPANLSNVVAVAVGNTYAMALRANGSVVAWGSGAGTNLPPGLTNVVAISAGNRSENLGLAVRANGTIVAWGDAAYSVTNPPAALGNLVAIAGAAADFHGLALVNDGSPQITQPPIGLTAYSGRNITLQASAAGAPPLSYQWLFNSVSLPGATNSSLALSNLQPANAGNYQLFVSNSLSTALSLPAPVTVISNSPLMFLTQTSVSATNVYQGGKVTLSSGLVLGSGPLSYQWFFSPTNRSNGLPFPAVGYSAVNGATNDTLVLNPALASQSGYYYVTVSNQVAGLSSAPVAVRVMFAKAWGYLATDPPFVLTNAIAIAVGNYGQQSAAGDYLALSAAGRISSWSAGFSQYGETNFSALSNSIVTAIAAGYIDTLALKSDGTVFAAGYGQYGVTNVPATANGITAIACGDYHDLALKYDGTVIGWGQNNEFQVSQVTNAALSNVVAIAAGGQDSIALRADGTVITWGNYGALPPSEWTIPLNATNIVAVAAGSSDFLALRANGTVVSWGNGPTAPGSVPASWSNLVAIAAGGNHFTALRNDGTVVTTGNSTIGSFSNNVPSDLANVIAIASSGDHDLGLFGTRAPAITVQPWNRTVFNTATSVWFSAKCAGVQPVRYQWQLNGTNVPGATNDTLTVNATVTNVFGLRTVLPLRSGVYQLVASNAYGVAASKYAQLTVVIPLGVALNATNLNWTTTGEGLWFGETNVTHDGVAAAQSGSLGTLQQSILQTTVATNVPGIYSFWWQVSSAPDFDFLEFRINGIVQTNISGAVNWQQVRIPVPAGTNVLTWRYSDESLFSSGLNAGWVDQFAFIPDPVILEQPVSRTTYAGSSVTFSVFVNSGLREQPQVGYQWQRNGVNLANGGNVFGATSDALTLNNVQDADAASYTVIITNSAGGNVTSLPATLRILDSPPVITSQPTSSTNYAGTTATFLLSSIGSTPMGYQWQKNGVNLAAAGIAAGAITLTLTNVQDADAASYAAILTNIQGSITSAPATLIVIDGPPVITAQPASLTAIPGQTATFAATAIGTAPMGYRWQFNGADLAQATNATLIIANAQTTNSGPYQLVVTNPFGSVTSSVVTLTVVHSWVVAWGDDTYGQTNVPATLPDVAAISAGWRHSLALQADTTVDAWGYNGSCTVGVPAGLTNVVAISAGDGWGLALRQDGSVVGLQCAGTDASAAFNVAGLSNITMVAAGWYHWLAATADGNLMTWSDANDSYTPTNIPPGLTNVTAIAAGLEYSLALKPDGTVVGWGWDVYGQTNVPAGLSNVTAIAASSTSAHSLALKADGTVVAWGADWSGQAEVPAGLSNVVAVAAGGDHSLALESDGTIVGWGANGTTYPDYGQATVPAGLSNVVAIAAGDTYSLALVNDGSPFITKQPASQVVTSNTTVQFSVSALGMPTLSYQWQKNGGNLADGVNVAGSTTAQLTLSNVMTPEPGAPTSRLAIYTVVITNGINSVTSSPATLFIASRPMITSQPASQTVSYGTNVRFNVVAIGYPLPAYQWWQNGTNPVGGNSPALTLTNVGRAQDGVYSVMVTNLEGGVASSNAVLQVLVPQRLGAPVKLSNGLLQFTSADVGGGPLSPSDLPNFEVQASADLIHWVPLPNALSLTNGMLQLQDNTLTNLPTRFYRIVEQ